MIAPAAAEQIQSRPGLAVGGAPLARAAGVIVALHGRGAEAGGMLDLAEHFARPDLAVLAPQAPGRAWYPDRFIAPLAANQPWLDRALATVSDLLDALVAAGLPDGRVALMGFSQGACLALETALRRPRPYGAILGLAGGYIGPPQTTPRKAEGRLDGVPVLLACATADPHIPTSRVHETADLMSRMGARVDLRLRPGAFHGIDEAGLAGARIALAAIAPG
jgi:phospholipase/carboxylesterase